MALDSFQPHDGRVLGARREARRPSLCGRTLKRYEHTTPERLSDRFVDAAGYLHAEADNVAVELIRGV